MAQGAVENMIILLWSCTVGLVLVLPVLLLVRKVWFPEEEKQLQANNPVGAALRGLLRESSSSRTVHTGSTASAEFCQASTDHCHHNICMSFLYNEPCSILKGEENKTFEELLHSKTVLLEKCRLECDKDCHAIKGVAAVINMELVKNIFVRYTKDNWSSFTDITAEFVSSNFAGDGTTFDQFQFKLPFNKNTNNTTDGDDGTKDSEWSCSMEFAIAYQVHNIEFWDNNNGQNYQVHLKYSHG